MLSHFVADAAPGEAAVIARDIDVLSQGNHATKNKTQQELQKHNTDSLRVVKVNNHRTVLSKYNKTGDKFWSRGKTFTVDHTSGITSDVQPGEDLDSKGSTLLREVEQYAAKHYADPVCDVFPFEDGYAIVIVGEKLSPRNFFNGAWTGQYTTSGHGVEGSVKVDVHYFEDGNVRLKAGHKVSGSGDPVKAIADAENKFQQDLATELAQLNERQFKALRRQLPVTRSHMVWSKATAGYKVGAQAASSERASGRASD